jgi:hypothetical protein
MKNPNSEYRDDRTWLPDDRYNCKTAYNLFLTALETEAETNEQIKVVLSMARRYSYLDIGSRDRPQQLADIRHWFIWWLRNVHPDGLSMAEIGRLVGNREHTTILHSLRKIETAKFDHFTLARFVADWVMWLQQKKAIAAPKHHDLRYEHAAQF